MKNVPPDGDTKRSTGSIRTAWRATIGSRPETDRALQHAAVQLGAFFSIPTENSDEVSLPVSAARPRKISGRLFALNHRNSNKISKAYSQTDRKSTRLNSSHLGISYAVF